MPDFPTPGANDVWGNQLVDATKEADLKTVPVMMPLIPGRWYDSQIATVMNTGATNQGYIHFLPFWVPAAATLNGLSMEVTTAAANVAFHLGVYAADGTAPMPFSPGTRLLDAGQVDAGTIGVKSITTGIALAVKPGVLWLAMLAGGTASGANYRVVAANAPHNGYLGYTNPGEATGGGWPPLGFVAEGTHTAFPATAPAGLVYGFSRPRIQVRVA